VSEGGLLGDQPRITLMQNSLPTLTAIELEKHITVDEAAALKGLCVDTFEEVYGHLIKKVSPRCRRVKLRTLLENEAAA
jgi:hypothetical protein